MPGNTNNQHKINQKSQQLVWHPQLGGRKPPKPTGAIKQNLQLTTVDVTSADCCSRNSPPKPYQNLEPQAKQKFLFMLPRQKPAEQSL
jgi:hypothetical protein